MNIITALREENDLLREQNRQLRDALQPPDVIISFEWRLTRYEQLFFRQLASRDLITRESAMLSMYGDCIGDPPEQKVLDVRICKMRKKRKKLKPFGVVIETVWGQGFRLLARQKYRASPKRRDV